MSLVKGSDVKNHLSLKFRTEIHLCTPESQSDATGFSGAECDIDKAKVAGFVADFVAEHSSPRGDAAPTDQLPGSFQPEVPEVSKSAQV